MAAPVDNPRASSELESRSKPKATAAKSSPASGRGYVKARNAQQKAYTKSEMDKFRYRKSVAPQEVKDAWDKAEALPKDDPTRQDLFEGILNANKGNYDDVALMISKSWTRETGMHLNKYD